MHYVTICQVAKLKIRQYLLGSDSPSLMLAKFTRYTVPSSIKIVIISLLFAQLHSSEVLTSIKNNKIEGWSRDGGVKNSLVFGPGYKARSKSTRTRFVRHKHLLYIPLLAFLDYYAPINVHVFIECSMWEAFRGCSLLVTMVQDSQSVALFCTPQKASVVT